MKQCPTRILNIFQIELKFRCVNIIENYNNCYHRSIKLKPSQVSAQNEDIVWETLYGSVYNNVIEFKFQVGDIVRFREFKDMRFDKGYVENWSEEVFTVIERTPEFLLCIE